MVAMDNSLNKLVEANNDMDQKMGYFLEWMEEILGHARREQAHR
jgi:hypothetical protein